MKYQAKLHNQRKNWINLCTLTQALKEIQKKANAKTTKKVIRDKHQVLEYLEDEDLAELLNIEREFDVTVNITKDNRLCQAEFFVANSILLNQQANFSHAVKLLGLIFFCSYLWKNKW